jgi:hypothetical protein
VQIRTLREKRDQDGYSISTDAFPPCDHEPDITCSDSATSARVIELLPDGMAKVDILGEVQEISVELVGAGEGDVVLVHAGIAIGKL